MTSVVPLSSYDYAAGPWLLRLTGQVSPLSALSERQMLRRLRFQLWLGDEPTPVDRVLEGDSLPSLPPLAPSGDSPARFHASGHGPDLVNLTHLVQSYVQDYLQGLALAPIQPLSQGPMTLAPVGMTRHRLTVGGVAQPTAVTLSLVQLADLAAVLDQAEQAVEPIPEEWATPQRHPTRRRLPLWLGSAAAVLVAAVLGNQWLGQGPVSVEAPSISVPPAAGDDPGGDVAPQASDPGAAAEDSSGFTPDPQASQPAPSSPVTSPAMGNRMASPSPNLSSPPGATPLTFPPSPNPGQGAPSPRPRPPTETLDTPPAATPSLEPASESLPSPARSSPDPAPLGASPGGVQPSPQPPQMTAAPSSTPLATDLAEGSTDLGLEALRRRLQDRWQPIPGLASPLRYRLTLGPTGEVLALVPLNPPARQYLTQDTLPPVGEVLPQIRLPQPRTVDLELRPSGEVWISIYDSTNE